MTAPRSAALPGVHTRAGSSNGLPKVQPATAAETAGVPIKSANGSTPRAWKITGLHQRIAKAVPAAQNPVAADVRGHLLNSVATRCMILQAYAISPHCISKGCKRIWRSPGDGITDDNGL
jgi:hypothetical protein